MSDLTYEFNLQINLTKSYDDDNGNYCLEVVASGPEDDLTDERMSPDALQPMVSSITKRLIEFRDTHKQEWNDDLGIALSQMSFAVESGSLRCRPYGMLADCIICPGLLATCRVLALPHTP